MQHPRAAQASRAGEGWAKLRPMNEIKPPPRSRGIYLLPNLFTTAGLFAGFFAIIAAANGQFVNAAIADKTLANAVADHKSIFFAEKNTQGDAIDYHAAVTGGLQLVPNGDALANLVIDYQHMIDDGLLLNDAEPFEVLIAQCLEIQKKANAN